ncbi:hypothetical protein [Paramylibacter kogurei]|uniref:hypothetical protein n=1 Tax=Paramylibacter kogurei TaxID=1889778 RepID=UPI0013FD4C6D|nr:hypothetical protein [Amylibacter kogurei]
MKPIKPAEFAQNTAPLSNPNRINLAEIGMLHAAPIENGQRILTFKFDFKTGQLFPN